MCEARGWVIAEYVHVQLTTLWTAFPGLLSGGGSGLETHPLRASRAIPCGSSTWDVRCRVLLTVYRSRNGRRAGRSWTSSCASDRADVRAGADRRRLRRDSEWHTPRCPPAAE